MPSLVVLASLSHYMVVFFVFVPFFSICLLFLCAFLSVAAVCCWGRLFVFRGGVILDGSF